MNSLLLQRPAPAGAPSLASSLATAFASLAGRGTASPPRPRVILLHASASSARQWDALAGTLRARFDVHAVDLHGHGGRPAWHGARRFGLHDDAALVLPLLDAAGEVHLVGHSYGAAVAMHVAAMRPGRLSSLCVYEPVLFELLAARAPRDAATREVLALVERMRGFVHDRQSAAAAEAFVDYWSGHGTWARMGAERQRSVAARMPLVLGHFDVLFAEPLPPERLARWTVPTLCLTGAASTRAALRIGALLRTLMPAARHETLDGLGHMGPLTHAARVNERVQRFVVGEADDALARRRVPA